MTKHLKKQGHIFHARMKVPADVRPHFEGKYEFSKSLKTGNLRDAQTRAAICISRWKQDIEAVRQGNTTENWARRWAEDLLKDQPAATQEVLSEVFSTELERRIDLGLVKPTEAPKLYQIAHGTLVDLAEEGRTYLAQYDTANYAPKSFLSYQSSLKHFIETFNHPEDVTKASVTKWWQELNFEKQLGHKTLANIKARTLSFWKFLKTKEIVSTNPFEGIELKPLNRKIGATQSYIPFTPQECVRILSAALESGRNDDMALMIRVGMYTGGRIEEICNIRKADIQLQRGWLRVPGTKTDASEDREVPIHPDLMPYLKTALDTCTDEYIIPGLETNEKTGRRSDAIGKRFGRLKTKLGFAADIQTFHSIRKCVITQFERANVPEGVSADIVGHEKNTMTYGLYSGGSSLEQKKDAIQALVYRRENGQPLG